jgi:hypothetical protein
LSINPDPRPVNLQEHAMQPAVATDLAALETLAAIARGHLPPAGPVPRTHCESCRAPLPPERRAVGMCWSCGQDAGRWNRAQGVWD